MNKLFYLLSFIFLNFSIYGQENTSSKDRNIEFYNATNKWFSAWKLVSKDIYKVKKVRKVDFVFFDDTYVYSTSSISVKNGTNVKGLDLMNLKLNWKRELHNNSLTLPDGQIVPVGVMSFAAPFNDKSFFVMPLPNYWIKSGSLKSKELGLENLITGIFLHEFSHSQQMQNFGKKITEYEKQINYVDEFNDNIIQNLFEKDAAFSDLFRNEVSFFYNSTKSNTLDKIAVQEGLKIMKQRQNTYFKEKYNALSEIDNFFLTMEGFGQYTMYLWLVHPKGGNIQKETAIKGVRRSGKIWSQEEGFALFLILDQLTASKNWAKDMFGNKTKSVIDLIQKNLNK